MEILQGARQEDKHLGKFIENRIFRPSYRAFFGCIGAQKMNIERVKNLVKDAILKVMDYTDKEFEKRTRISEEKDIGGFDLWVFEDSFFEIRLFLDSSCNIEIVAYTADIDAFFDLFNAYEKEGYKVNFERLGAKRFSAWIEV